MSIINMTNTTNDLTDHNLESTTSPSVLNISNMSYLTRMTDEQLLQAVITELDNENEMSNEIRPDITTQATLTTPAKALKHFKVVRLVLKHLFGTEITFPIADPVPSAHAAQEAKLLTLYCSTRSKTLVEKVLSCPANEITPALVHHFFARLAWINESTLTSARAQAQLEKYLFGINPFWDQDIQLGAGDYSELSGLLTHVPADLCLWMIQFKRGERLYIAAEWLATVSAEALYDGFAQGEEKKDADPLLAFTTAFDRLLAPLPHEYQDNLLAPALTEQISSVATWLSIEIYLFKMADCNIIDLGEPVSLATRILFYQKIAQYVINPNNENWLATDIERAQNAPGMQTLSLAISLRREHSTLQPDQALKIAALLLAPMIIQVGEAQEVENAPNPLLLIDPLPKLNVLLAESSSTAPADQLFNLIGIDTLCQHNGMQRQLRQSARDTWQALMQTTQFTEFATPLLKRIGWYGGEAKERPSPRVTQALVGKVIIEHFLGATAGTARSIMQEFRDNQVTEYTHAQLFDRLKASITLRNSGVSTATLDMLHYLLCREIAPELLIRNVPNSLCYGRSLQSVALLHGVALLEAMTPGASHGAKFDDLITLSAQLANSQDPPIQKLWAETQVYPALRYAQAHNAITPINDIHTATKAQITTAVNYLRDQQNQHANALNKLQSKAPDRRAIAQQQLTNAGVDQQYWSLDPRPHQQYLEQCHVLKAAVESWDESKANFFINLAGAAPGERGGYIPHAPEAYPSLLDLMMMGDRYIEGVQDVPHAFDSAFTLFCQTITQAEADIIQRLLLELSASDRALLTTSTCELSRLKFADQQAYQGIFIRCQSGDHRSDFKQHNSATEAYFEIIPAAGVARKIEQRFDYSHHHITDQPDPLGITLDRLYDEEATRRQAAIITPLLPFDSNAYLHGTPARSMKEVPDPRKATLLPAAPLLFTASADQTAAMNTIATAAAQHLLADPLATTKKAHSGETRWEQVFASERAIVDFMARTLLPFFGCITDLTQGNRSAGVIGGCALDIAFSLIPLGQFVGSTARIIWRAGEMSLISLGEAMSDATVKLISGLAQQSTVFALPDLLKGGRWLLVATWRKLLDQAPILTTLTKASRRLIEEGIVLNGSYYRAPQGLTSAKFPTTILGDLEQERHVLTRSTSKGSVHAVDALNNLPYGSLLSLPGYAGEHATFFYPREIKLVPNVHNEGFITDIALNQTARIVDRDNLGIDFGVGSHVYRATPHQSVLHDLEHRVSPEAENLASVSCGLRVRRSLGEMCLEKELESFDDPLKLRYQALTHKRYQHSQAGEQTAGLLALERRIYRYDPAGEKQLALAEEVNTLLIYKKNISGRIESEPLFGKPHAFADEMLDQNTYVIKLDAIVNNIADKRTLRALIIADPNQQGVEIIMLEADPLVFYGAKMPNARNLKWFNQVQFVRYSETNAQEKAVIDHYLATIKKEYHPQDKDTLLAAESVPGVLSLPLARFNAPLSENVSLAFTAKEVSIPRYDGIHIDIKSDNYGNTTRKCSLGRGHGSIPVIYDTDWETWRKITDTIVMKETSVTSKKQLGDPIWPDQLGQWKFGSYADFQQIKNQLPIAINHEIITLGSISSVPPAQATLIPQQIHYIWVGEVIPKNLLENITKNVENSPQYKSIIHVDADSSTIFKEIKRQLNNKITTKIFEKIKSKLGYKMSNIEIRDLHEDNFFLNFRNTDSGEMYQHFRAGIGKNYSATADVLRYSLVDEHGGIYLDTDDTLVRHVHGIQLKAMPNDILLNGVVTHEPTFFKGHNTSCFASQPNNPVLKEIIKEMNRRYKANASFFATPRPYVIPGQPRGISGEFNNYQRKIFEITGPKMFDDVLRQQRPDYYFLDKLHEKHRNFSSGVVSKEYTVAAKNAYDYYFPFDSMFFEVNIGAEQSMQHTR